MKVNRAANADVKLAEEFLEQLDKLPVLHMEETPLFGNDAWKDFDSCGGQISARYQG